jgi:hypothetical protein
MRPGWGQHDPEAQQKGSVPRARIELATHGSSGHVPSDLRNRAGTHAGRHMVMTNDKLFNETDGEQAFRSWRRRSEVPIEAMDG